MCNASEWMCVRVIQHCRHNMTWLLFIVISFHFVFEPDRFACFLSIIFRVCNTQSTEIHAALVHSHFNRLRFIIIVAVFGWSIGWLALSSVKCAYVRVRWHKMMRCTSWCVHSIECDWCLNFLFTYAILYFLLVRSTWRQHSNRSNKKCKTHTHSHTQSKFI